MGTIAFLARRSSHHLVGDDLLLGQEYDDVVEGGRGSDGKWKHSVRRKLKLFANCEASLLVKCRYLGGAQQGFWHGHQ